MFRAHLLFFTGLEAETSLCQSLWPWRNPCPWEHREGGQEGHKPQAAALHPCKCSETSRLFSLCSPEEAAAEAAAAPGLYPTPCTSNCWGQQAKLESIEHFCVPVLGKAAQQTPAGQRDRLETCVPSTPRQLGTWSTPAQLCSCRYARLVQQGYTELTILSCSDPGRKTTVHWGVCDPSTWIWGCTAWGPQHLKGFNITYTIPLESESLSQ